MSRNNYMGKIDEDYYNKFFPHFEMMSGSETKEYLYYRYSNAPFGYRPANIDDIPNKENIIKNIIDDLTRTMNKTYRLDKPPFWLVEWIKKLTK